MATAMATTRSCLKSQIELNYDNFTKKCENYVSANEETAENIKIFLKSLYGVIKGTEESEGLSSGETLPELIVDNFDEEQIWQELELQNEARVDSLVGNVARLVAQKDKFSIDKGFGQKASGKDGNKVKVKKSSTTEAYDEEKEDNDDGDSDDNDDEDASENDLDFSLDDNDLEDEEIGDDMDEEEDIGDDDEIDEDLTDASDDEHKEKSKSKKVMPRKFSTPSAVDDKFFKLSEMEEFLEREEREDFDDGDDSSEDSIDLFDDMPSDESDGGEEEDDDSQDDSKKPHYSDFFDAPDQEDQDNIISPESKSNKPDKKRKVKFNLGGISEDNREEEHNKSDSESDNDLEDSLDDSSKGGKKSSYEIRQERLQAKIKKLEEEALSEKPWQLRGEITGESRPENALLEEALEFDLTHRPAPVVTEETTQRLEDIIKQRIKDKAWDDVERKVKPVEVSEFKKKLVLDQEKSKQSLSQVYEQEYLKQVEAKNPDTSDKPEEIPKEHIEIKAMVNSLFRKLDSLSNFHFTPKQVAPEVKIVTNIPAINMEEVAPVATSDATLLAPEEVKAKPKGDIKSQGEKTDTDRKRERRQKKKHQRLVGREREKREATVAKLKPGLGNKYSKEKAVKMLEKLSKDSNVSLIENTRGAPAVKSSSSFFSQLQDEVTSQMKDKTKIVKKRKADTKSLSAKRLKL
ncbi:U3 small nucleolar ribonucleoprotein protein MPP10 [Frankliniella occidentalis]|uniref:U3 small nucleolar ribonucleoprotein protein MPP10 n=1 Tax=Frankliniella occidentalis TaxID=133901 RepID=A0A9C6X308_FRAOC|nr:U3 small nucleolar ribonucleoprotein protein MPP10 [Frankliniella occidentalis]